MDTLLLLVAGDTGLMGGKLSHEFHVVSDIGEDRILVCPEWVNCKTIVLYKLRQNSEWSKQKCESHRAFHKVCIISVDFDITDAMMH